MSHCHLIFYFDRNISQAKWLVEDDGEKLHYRIFLKKKVYEKTKIRYVANNNQITLLHSPVNNTPQIATVNPI